MLAVTGLVPVFVAVKATIFPLPLVPKLILAVSFVQEYVVVPPVFVVPKLIAVSESLLQTVLLEIVFTLADGLIVMVKAIGVPLQLFVFVNDGVTVIVAVIGVVPELRAVKEGISPLPLVPIPMEGVLLVQV